MSLISFLGNNLGSSLLNFVLPTSDPLAKDPLFEPREALEVFELCLKKEVPLNHLKKAFDHLRALKHPNITQLKLAFTELLNLQEEDQLIRTNEAHDRLVSESIIPFLNQKIHEPTLLGKTTNALTSLVFGVAPPLIAEIEEFAENFPNNQDQFSVKIEEWKGEIRKYPITITQKATIDTSFNIIERELREQVNLDLILAHLSRLTETLKKALNKQGLLQNFQQETTKRYPAAQQILNKSSLDEKRFLLQETIEIFSLDQEEEAFETLLPNALNNLRKLGLSDLLLNYHAHKQNPDANFIEETLLPTLQVQLQETDVITPLVTKVKENILGKHDPRIDNFFKASKALKRSLTEPKKERCILCLNEIQAHIDDYKLTVLQKRALLEKLETTTNCIANRSSTQKDVSEHLNDTEKFVSNHLVQRNILSSFSAAASSQNTLANSVSDSSIGSELTLGGILETFFTKGLSTGLYSIAAKAALTALEHAITHVRGQNPLELDTLIDPLEESIHLLEEQIGSDNQTSKAYQHTFQQVWQLSTQNPILLGGIELPIGLDKEEGPTPVEQLQRIAAKFQESHSYLYDRVITKEQTDAKIEVLAQTAACFSTYRISLLAIGELEGFPSFYEMLGEVSEINDPQEKKEAFLTVLNRAIQENNQINVVISWAIRAFMPVIFWFSELFSNNLTGGLKNYFRNVVIPTVKKDVDKRLHSASIACIGKCFDDLNKMIADSAENPKGRAWNIREHIRLTKDRKIYNGERTADELYTEFAEICVEEIMPKIDWTSSIHSWDLQLNAWANDSDSAAFSIFKHIVVFPLRLPIWILEYMVVLPIQSIIQSILTWGAKKCFVDTNLIKGLMDNIKTTRFQDTPYVPILDTLAGRLLDIHAAQKRAAALDPTLYNSDDENKQTIKDCLDRLFGFVSLWNLNSPRQIRDVIQGPQGFFGGVQKLAEDALLPPIQNVLVELIELVQSLATEETQLERFLYELCDVANDSFSQEGRQLSAEEKARKAQQYVDTKNLIDCTLNAILWTVCIDATNSLGSPAQVRSAKDHVNWLKDIFLGSTKGYPSVTKMELDKIRSFAQRPNEARILDEDEGGSLIDEEESMPNLDDAESFSGLIQDEDYDLFDIENTAPRLGQREHSLYVQLDSNPHIEEELSSPMAKKDKGVIQTWMEALDTLCDDPENGNEILNNAYKGCSELVQKLEIREVELQINPGSRAPKLGPVTAEHLKRKSSLICASLEKVCDQFHRLHRLYTYHQYSNLENNPVDQILSGFGIVLNDVEIDYPALDAWITQTRQMPYENWPLSLNQAIAAIEQLRDWAKEAEENRERIDSQLEKIAESFDLIRRENEESQYLLEQFPNTRLTPLINEVALLKNHITNLRKTVEDTTHVEFLQLNMPKGVKSASDFAMSVLRQTLFKEMSSRSITLIQALGNSEVFEMLIRHLAIRPLVESFKGEKVPSFAADE